MIIPTYKNPKFCKEWKYPLREDIKMDKEYILAHKKELNEWYASLTKEEKEILECGLLVY